MTINLADNSPRVSYAVAEGVTQSSFTVSFEFFEDADLNVYVDGTLKTLTTDYTVSGGDGSTGSVAISVTGASGGSTVVITRSIALERTTDFPSSGPFDIASLNTELDKVIGIAADLDDEANRGLRLKDQDEAVSTELPLKADRLGKVLAFNETTGVPEAGPTIADTQSLANITADIATLADIEDGTDATDAIQTVSGISSDVTTVSGISGNVTTVAGISADVTAVAGDATDIGTVATNIASVNTVATNINDVITVANDLAEAVSEVETVANDLNEAVSEIDTVATSISNVDTVGTNIANVNTVAGIDSNVTTVAGISANVTTVAGISANVTTVAGISGNVTTVAGISSDVTAVAADATDIGAVATNLAGTDTIGTVATNISNVNTVAGINANVTTVAGISSDVTAVAADATDIGTVATNIANVNSVGGSISNVNTVATNISSVNDFADKYRIGASDPTTDNDEGDLFYNTTSDTLKVYTGSAWEQGVTAGSGFLPTTGGSLTGDVSFGDNNKATFGDAVGGDLQIYSDGNNSIIKENSGTGNLFVQATSIYFKDATNTETYAEFVKDGAVKLLYDNNVKAQTTSSGIDVTGSVTADGLTVDTDTFANFGSNSNAVTGINFKSNRLGAYNSIAQINGQWDGTDVARLLFVTGSDTTNKDDGRIYLQTAPDGTTGLKSRVFIDREGDISFYDSTGVTQGFFWDASTQRLGLGTTSPTSPLHVETTSQRVGTFISTGADPQVYVGDAASSDNAFILGYDRADNRGYLTVAGDSDSVFTIANGGNVGIGTATINDQLVVNSSSAEEGITIRGDNFDALKIGLVNPGTSNDGVIGMKISNALRFITNDTERMRIDSSGKVGIGETSPNAGLHVRGLVGAYASMRLACQNDTTAFKHIIFQNDTDGEIGSVSQNAAGTVSYNTSSDYRLKENVANLTGATERLKQIPVHRFNFISKPDTTVDGFLAHEVQDIVPEAVTGTHNEVETWTQDEIDAGDAPDNTSAGDNKLDDDGNTIPVYQGIDQSKLVPLLTGALQEAITKIETLETKVAALEAAN